MTDAGDARLHWGVKIPLRDGVSLNATLYTPQSHSAPQPCILMMTPYIADTMHSWGMYFARHGFPTVVVDVRGRGNSEGHFRPNIQEAKDGHDVVEWLARQPYCNGKVAMCGGSYLGAVQWATASEFPAHLSTIVPAAAPYIGTDFPMRNNIFYPYLVQWLTLTSGVAAQKSIFSDFPWWSKMFRRWFESGRSFRELDTFIGHPSRILQEWLDHPSLGPYWDEYNPTPEHYARIELPILTMTGAYDDDQPGALEHYKQHVRLAGEAARARHYLIIGPWDHAGSTGHPRIEFGGLKLGPASLLDILRLHLEWYAWILQEGPKPPFLRKLVAYYVMGVERWRYADTLEAITARHDPLYLDSQSNATDVFSSGCLQALPGTGLPDCYTYDPRDLSGLEIAAEADVPVGSLVDQTMVMTMRGRQLVYHSTPFPTDIQVNGFFRLRAWIAIDCPDTDLYATVSEIALDGGSIRLTTDQIRARYREGLRSPKPIQTADPLQYDFEGFTFISRQIKRGHRLRLVIAPLGRPIDATFSERNFNGGGVVADESVENARIVTVRMFHDQARPSALYVPMGQAESADEPQAPEASLSSQPAANR
ncbi:MAG: CocE/NonD family hydrolase [Steroidobacteraceae bacterium]